jgi:hypothetical protein
MAMATEVTDERLAAIKTTVEKAHRELGEVCSAGVSRRWRMSIPADFTRDSDLIIGDGLRAAHDLAAEVERLRAELARLSAVPAADVERLREALATRERQLSYAVAGMGQGKEGTFFAVKDEAGRVCDVVMAKLSSAHGCVQPAELAPIAASPASGAALNMADFDPTGIELPPELQTSDELARRIAAYALGIGDTAAGVWCTRALSDRMELLGPGGFTMTALLPASPGAIDIMATVQDIADRMNASPPSPAPTGTAEAPKCTVCGAVATQRDIDGNWWPPCEHAKSKGIDTLKYDAPAEAYREGRAHGAEVAAVRELVRPERDAVLEEAAGVADGACRAGEKCQRDGGCRHVPCVVARGIAAAIRKLKGQVTAGGVEGGWVARAEYQRVYDLGKRYESAIMWALGLGGDFATQPEGAGKYWWRKELRVRAGMLFKVEAPPLPPSPPAPTTDTKGGD